MKRHHPHRIGRQHTGQTMKITTLALIATATVAATIALPTIANADTGSFSPTAPT
jgi:hypothetical protein